MRTDRPLESKVPHRRVGYEHAPLLDWMGKTSFRGVTDANKQPLFTTVGYPTVNKKYIFKEINLYLRNASQLRDIHSLVERGKFIYKSIFFK